MTARPTPRTAAPLAIGLADPDVERVTRNHAEILAALLRAPAGAMRIIAAVELTDGTETPVAHGLGRAPAIVIPGAPKGSGLTGGTIHEVPNSSVDRREIIILRATGYGATITVDLAVM